MHAEYDEDLSENRFLQELRSEHEATLERAIRSGWIICVPRSKSFADRPLEDDEVNAHILMPGRDAAAGRFDSLNGGEVLLVNRVLTVRRDDVEQCSSRLLFEEIFYSKDLRKYCVWCVERPLESSMYVSDSSVSVITNLQEAMNFLQAELLDKQLRDDFEARIKDFLCANKDLECKPMEAQRDLIQELYADCHAVLLKNTALREKVSDDKHYHWNIRVSLETYILYALRNVLLQALSARTVVEDACLNKIIRNLDEIELDDLRVRSDLQSRVHGGKKELSRLDCLVTVLGKIECLRRTVNYVSRGTSSVSSDDLLPVLVFLIIKAGLPNWTAQLFFMRHFRLSMNSAHEADEAGFLITSLEAAIEHIKSGAICAGDKSTSSPDVYNQLMSDQERSSVSYLFACIKNGNLSEVERILTYNGSTQADDVALCHPLCTCASCEHNWTKHRDLNARPKDDKGLTPLHVAVLHDQIVIVDFLLDRETDINAADSNGLTALHYACMKGHQNILLLMLHANADPSVTDSRGNTPLHLAVDRGHESCVKALLYLSEHMKAPVDANVANDHGDTPLHLAARWGYCAIVRILLEYGAGCRAINKKGQMPSAITYSGSIAELLRHNATGDIRNGTGSSPRRGHARSHQSISFKQRHWTTTTTASTTSEVAKGAASDPEGYASAMQHRMMDKLLAAIVDGDICLACYYLGLEVYRERPPGARASLCHHPLCDCERCAAFGERKLERELGRRRPLAINASNSRGETALHVASATGRTRMVQLLLDAGANVNVATVPDSHTPLHLACRDDQVDAARLLLNCATCDVDAKDQDGNTSLHLATTTGDARLVALLIRCGANAGARNLENKTPLRQAEEKLSVAFSENYANILKILKQNSAQTAGD